MYAKPRVPQGTPLYDYRYLGMHVWQAHRLPPRREGSRYLAECDDKFAGYTEWLRFGGEGETQEH